MPVSASAAVATGPRGVGSISPEMRSSARRGPASGTHGGSFAGVVGGGPDGVADTGAGADTNAGADTGAGADAGAGADTGAGADMGAGAEAGAEVGARDD